MSGALPLHLVASRLPDVVDLFICGASYEERCRSIPNQVPPDRVASCLVLRNTYLGQHVSSNASYLLERFHSGSRTVELSSEDPLATADNISSALNEVTGRANIRCAVDITTMTHESLIILLGLLLPRIQRFKSIDLLYANAAQYSPGFDDAEKWLSKGVREVRSILGFAGDTLPWRPAHLVVLVGYEHERALALASILEPQLISLGLGVSDRATRGKHQRLAERYFKLVYSAAAAYGSVRQFEFPCQQPAVATHVLLEQVAAVQGYNTIVAPMNTKLSTVACYLAALQEPSIQLCYAQAMTYNVRAYSLPGDSFYTFDLLEQLHTSGAVSDALH